MSQPKKTFEEVHRIVSEVRCPPYTFKLIEKGPEIWLLQLTYVENDTGTGELSLQKTRKWYISPYSTTTEIVETCYAACLRSAKHRIREHFTYVDRQVMSPHFHIIARVAYCDDGQFDRRIPPNPTEQST